MSLKKELKTERNNLNPETVLNSMCDLLNCFICLSTFCTVKGITVLETKRLSFQYNSIKMSTNACNYKTKGFCTSIKLKSKKIDV